MTIKEDIKALRIEPQHFDNFYQQLEKNNQLPSKDDFPSDQYKAIVDYLKEEEVLGEGDAINGKNLKSIILMKRIEEMTEEMGELPSLRGSGGIMPCRSYNRGSGGLMSCRDYD